MNEDLTDPSSTIQRAPAPQGGPTRPGRRTLCVRLGDLWRAISTPLLIVLATRAGLFLLAYLSLVIMPIDCHPWIDEARRPWQGFADDLLLDGWARWDSSWYANIAEQGYSLEPIGDSGQRNLAFMPLYPLSIRALLTLIGNPMLAGIIVSNVSLVLSMILLYRLVRARYGLEVAAPAVLLFCAFPFSFYLSAGYSEGVFLLCVVGAFYFAERENWALAGLCGLLAGATRIPGIALAPALALLYLEKIHFRVRRVRWNILWLILAALGPLLYAGYLWARFGDPLLSIKSSQVEGWWLNGPNLELALDTLRRFASIRNFITGNYNGIYTMNLLTAIFFLISLVLVFRRQPAAYGVFSLLLIVFGVGQWVGLGRYVLGAFPVFVAWAMTLKNRYLFDSVLMVSSLLLALLTMMYAHWYWVS